MARRKKRKKGTSSSPVRGTGNPNLGPVAAEVPIQHPSHSAYVKLRGKLEDDGTVTGRNGIRWKLA